MKSGIFDKNGIEVKVDDTVVFPYIDPNGKVTKDAGFAKIIVFDQGCFGYYDETSFNPLFEWQAQLAGDYVPNCGNKVIYTGKYPFWVDNN